MSDVQLGHRVALIAIVEQHRGHSFVTGTAGALSAHFIRFIALMTTKMHIATTTKSSDRCQMTTSVRCLFPWACTNPNNSRRALHLDEAKANLERALHVFQGARLHSSQALH